MKVLLNLGLLGVKEGRETLTQSEKICQSSSLELTNYHILLFFGILF